MVNTVGESMEFHTLTYRVDDPEAALRASALLANGDDPEQIVATAKRDWRGTLRSASLPWSRAGNKAHGGAPDTTLADFTINGTKLTVHVNSFERPRYDFNRLRAALGLPQRPMGTADNSSQ